MQVPEFINISPVIFNWGLVLPGLPESKAPHPDLHSDFPPGWILGQQQPWLMTWFLSTWVVGNILYYIIPSILFIFNKIWEASLTNLSQELRISLIHHSNAVTHPVLETVASSSGPLALQVPQPPRNGSLLLLLPMSRVTLLQSWVLPTIHQGDCFKSLGHHYFYHRLC